MMRWPCKSLGVARESHDSLWNKEVLLIEDGCLYTKMVDLDQAVRLILN